MAIVTVKVDNKEHKFYMDKKLKQNIDILLDACKDDDDFFIVFSGAEGAGKSVFMQQVGAYCADYLGTEYNIDNIVFDLKEYLTKSIHSPNYTVINLDEARKILNRSAGATKDSRIFTNYASECRSKRQVHIIGLPAYHDLNPYIINWRIKILIQVLKTFEEDPTKKSGYALSRGKFKLYTNKEQINKYYEFKYKYPKQYESFGTFPNYKIINDDIYNEKKGENLINKYDPAKQEEELGKKEREWRTRLVKIVRGVNKIDKVQLKTMAGYADMLPSSLHKLLTYDIKT